MKVCKYYTYDGGNFGLGFGRFVGKEGENETGRLWSRERWCRSIDRQFRMAWPERDLGACKQSWLVVAYGGISCTKGLGTRYGPV